MTTHTPRTNAQEELSSQMDPKIHAVYGWAMARKMESINRELVSALQELVYLCDRQIEGAKDYRQHATAIAAIAKATK